MISFTLNGNSLQVTDLPPTTTLLQYLRDQPHLTGTKEGCAEGDCGACTVVILDHRTPSGAAWRSVNSCLVLMPMLHGKQVYTVEGLAQGSGQHPVQDAVVRQLGSQCGYCTPGVVMTLAEACYRTDMDAGWKMDDQLCGTLCRCTGYRPIRDAAEEIKGLCPADALSTELRMARAPVESLDYQQGEHRFLRPNSLKGLWKAVKAYPDHKLIAGATDLGLNVTKQHQTWPVLIGLDSVEELTHITCEKNQWSIGAAVRLSDLETVTDQPLNPLARMLRYFGARQIKNRATVGGNLCNASPIGDLAPILLALQANVVLGSPRGERTIPLDEFFLDYRKTALAEDEVMVRVSFPQPSADVKLCAYKVSKRRELDISAVSAGMAVSVDVAGRVENVRLGYGGLAATPKRATQTEAALKGQPWTEATVRAVLDLLEQDFTPMSDHRGSAWYRMRVAKNLLLGFYLETQQTAQPRLTPRHSGTVQPGGIHE